LRRDGERTQEGSVADSSLCPLRGDAQDSLHAGEHAIRCEHGVATMANGPLQRFVSWAHPFSSANSPVCGVDGQLR
jgi:hypothetical protein